MSSLFSETAGRTDPGASAEALHAPALADRFAAVRRFSETLCEPLETEDLVVQSMPDVSPTRWHLAHTTWFFETFVLREAVSDYRPLHPQYAYLFNSYYNAAGPQFPRPRRGLLSRPTVEQVLEYRSYVDEHVRELLGRLDPEADRELTDVIELGVHHEQQHQELMLTDIKHVFSCNPLHPVYRQRNVELTRCVPELRWAGHPEQTCWIGHEGDGFCYDNEQPRHRVFLQDFEIAGRLVTNAEYLAFMDDGGYRRPELWLSDGWSAVQERRWQAPLYWERGDGGWWSFTLSGLRPVNPAEPVCHVSFYEADAYARWAGARLPTEAEWEIASAAPAVGGNFVETAALHPVPLDETGEGPALAQMFGDVWEWTGSPYVGYPGYRPGAGALGEYNGKFMCSQIVLRGGSCATPRSHIRRTYRNFWAPATRWQFTGIRLAK